MDYFISTEKIIFKKYIIFKSTAFKKYFNYIFYKSQIPPDKPLNPLVSTNWIKPGEHGTVLPQFAWNAILMRPSSQTCLFSPVLFLFLFFISQITFRNNQAMHIYGKTIKPKLWANKISFNPSIHNRRQAF